MGRKKITITLCYGLVADMPEGYEHLDRDDVLDVIERMIADLMRQRYPELRVTIIRDMLDDAHEIEIDADGDLELERELDDAIGRANIVPEAREAVYDEDEAAPQA